MAYEEIGYGGVGGLIVAALTFLGWNRRLNKLEDSKVDAKFCDTIHKNVENNFLDIKENLKYIRDRVDEIANNARK